MEYGDYTKKELATFRLKSLEDARQTWINHWQDISQYILPKKGRFYGTTQNDGKKLHSQIVDGTAQRALRVLAAGMQGGLTSPSRPWFKLGFSDFSLNDNSEVKWWLDNVERIMYQAFAKSNFYSAIHTLYSELAAFGTGALVHEEGENSPLNFRVLTTGRYAIGLNNEGVADSIARRVWLEARNVISRFGEENVSRYVKQLAVTQPCEFVELIHLVYPRNKRDKNKKDSTNKAFESIWWEAKNNDGDKDKVLEVSGFDEFPVHCPRWDVTAEEIYGRSPGMDALGDVKMLQEVVKSEIKAIHKSVDPPMQIPAAFKGRLSMLPGAQNRTSQTGNDAGGIRPIYQIGINLRHTSEKVLQLQKSVREEFFNDLFLMIQERPGMTATEVLERSQEKMLMLGPVIERQEHELLDPLIERAFGILYRGGYLPQPPDIIQGQELKVEYISLLAKAQQLAGTQAIERTTKYVLELSQVKPEALDFFNQDEAVKRYAEMHGSPPQIIRPDDEVQKLRQDRAQQQAQMLQQQQMAQEAETAKTLSETPVEEGTALEAVAGGAR